MFTPKNQDIAIGVKSRSKKHVNMQRKNMMKHELKDFVSFARKCLLHMEQNVMSAIVDKRDMTERRTPEKDR